LGYKRIGTALDDRFVYGTRRGVKWYTGYLDCQDRIPRSDRIPIFGTGALPPEERWPEAINGPLATKFREWFLKWHPDAVISMVGREKKWLKSMKLNVPRDVGLACLAHPAAGRFAGIDENGAVIGATAVELVSAQISHNEYGPPSHPKIMMIAGHWVNGATVRKKI
jgi:LacI family transcriptional regulator